MNILKAPTFTKESLQRHLRKYTNLGTLLNYKKIEGGVANFVYKIKTTRSVFTLKLVVRNNPHRVKYEIELLNKLKNLPTPKPIKAKDGKYLVEYKKHQTMLYPYLVGTNKHINKKMSYNVGRFLGKMHRQTENFTSEIRRVKLYAITKKKVNYMYKASKFVSNQKIRKAMLFIKTNALKYKLPNYVPSGAMHLDISYRNILFSEKKLTGVVDFDNSYNGPLILDLAGAFIGLGYTNNKFNLEIMKELYRGYTRERKLNSKEKKELFGTLHYYILGITLHGMEFYIQKKLGKQFIINMTINHLLEAEKKLDSIERRFNEIIKNPL